MDSKTLQPTLIDAQTLQQLKDEIKQELLNVLNNSNLSKVIEKYGISAQDIFKLEYTLDLNKLQPDDVGVHQQTQQFLQAFPDQTLNTLCMVLRKPCPFDNNPDGCWTDC